MSRDREDECATGQPQGVGSEAYLDGTSQGPTPEDARKDGHIRGRSKRFMKYPGLTSTPGKSISMPRPRHVSSLDWWCVTILNRFPSSTP
jgi:hypothetical protein